MPNPTPGLAVHYEGGSDHHLAAIVTAVKDRREVSLAVLSPIGMTFVWQVIYQAPATRVLGTWHCLSECDV